MLKVLYFSFVLITHSQTYVLWSRMDLVSYTIVWVWTQEEKKIIGRIEYSQTSIYCASDHHCWKITFFLLCCDNQLKHKPYTILHYLFKSSVFPQYCHWRDSSMSEASCALNVKSNCGWDLALASLCEEGLFLIRRWRKHERGSAEKLHFNPYFQWFINDTNWNELTNRLMFTLTNSTFTFEHIHIKKYCSSFNIRSQNYATYCETCML